MYQFNYTIIKFKKVILDSQILNKQTKKAHNHTPPHNSSLPSIWDLFQIKNKVNPNYKVITFSQKNNKLSPFPNLLGLMVKID